MILAIVILLSPIKHIESSCVAWDKGKFSNFNSLVDPSFQCLNNAKFTGSIQFSGSFSNIPQIIMAQISYKYDKNSQFRFSILTTTIQEWTFSIECFSSQLYKYEFTWIATDDRRLYVINEYMNKTQLVTGFRSNYYSHPFSNGKLTATVQIVSYFGGESDVYVTQSGSKFSFYVSSGTSGLGLQFIIGWTEYLLMFDQYYAWIKQSLQMFIPSNLNLQQIFAQTGFFEPNDINPSLQFRQVDIDYYIQINGSLMLNFTGDGFGSFNFKLFSYDISPIIFEPLYFQKMRISKKVSLNNTEYLQLWVLQIKEINIIFKDQQHTILNGSSQSMSLIYSYKCQPGKKVLGNILKCQQCMNQWQDFTQYCHKSFNLMRIYLRLYQNYQPFSELDFELTDQGFTIHQKINKSSACNDRVTFAIMNLTIVDK